MITIDSILKLAGPPTPQQIAAAHGLPIPDEREAYVFHTSCPSCGGPLRLSVDVSSGPGREVGTECDCGALPIWRVDWWYAVNVTDYVRDDRQR